MAKLYTPTVDVDTERGTFTITIPEYLLEEITVTINSMIYQYAEEKMFYKVVGAAKVLGDIVDVRRKLEGANNDDIRD